MRCIQYNEKDGKRTYRIVNIPFYDDGMPHDYREMEEGPVHRKAELDPLPLEINERIIVYHRKEIVDPFVEILWYEYHKEGCQCGVCSGHRDLITGYILSDEECFERGVLWDLFDRHGHPFARWDQRLYYIIFAAESPLGKWIVDLLPRVKETRVFFGPKNISVFSVMVEGEDRARAYQNHIKAMGVDAGRLDQTQF